MEYWGSEIDAFYSQPKVITETLEYTFTWLIENYSYCSQKKREVLESPGFIVNGLEGIPWCIQLYPRRILNDDSGYISIILRRNRTDDGPESIPVKYELSLLAADGSVVISKEFNHEFKRGYERGSVDFLPMNDLFSRHKDALLPQDTLSVRCKMSIYEFENKKFGQSLARTRIRVEHFYFIQVVEGFSALKPKEKKTIFYESRGTGLMKARLKLTDSSSSDGTITLKITPPGDKKVLSTCKLFLVGASGILTKCLEGDNRADAKRKDIRKLPLSLTKKEILDRKEEFLADDKLTVLCQLSFSTGVKYEKIEKTVYDIPPLLLNQMNNDLWTENLFTCSSVDDLIKL